jgi:hypothetical protein
MRSPWIDLLFLHGHVTPGKLAWRPDAPACECQSSPYIEVDVAQLPLSTRCEKRDPVCCA